MTVRIEPTWKAHLRPEFDKPYWIELTNFVRAEYAAGHAARRASTSSARST